MPNTPIDPTSPLPRWAQIAEILRRRIAERGPALEGLSDDALSREFGVSALTVRQAMQDLVRRGLVERRRGKGTVVVAQPRADGADRLEEHVRTWLFEGPDLQVRILERDRVPADLSVASELRLPPGARVGYLRRLRSVSGRPVAIDYRWIPRHIDERLTDDHLSAESFWRTIEAALGLEMGRVDTAIRAAGAGVDEARLLQVPPGSPVLHRSLVFYAANGEAVLTGYSVHHPERYIVASTVRR